MDKRLEHDAATGQLLLVYTDLWDGQHERTAYRVTGERSGRPLRGSQWAEYDGRPVFGTLPGLYVRNGDGSHTAVWTEETATGPTEKTPCRKAGNARRKCALCG